MKPVAFQYFAPRSLDEALDLLAEHSEEGKILAGSQSLVPAMNFRLARPESRIAELDYVREQGATLRIGTLARHARFEAPLATAAFGAPLPRIARHIAHLPIRCANAPSTYAKAGTLPRRLRLGRASGQRIA